MYTCMLFHHGGTFQSARVLAFLVKDYIFQWKRRKRLFGIDAMYLVVPFCCSLFKEEIRLFPILETERIRLREIKKEDANRIFSYFSSDEVTRYYGQDSFQKIEDAENLIELFHKNYSEKRGIRWGIECKKTNELIGTIGFHLWSPRHKRAEIGYDLHPDNWGHGYAQEAVAEILSYGFNVMELTRIGAVVFIENESSNKLLLKLGFEREGILKSYMYQDGVAYDTYVYSLIRKNYL